jgi:coatomer protein complex subunit epsilon
MHQQKYAEADGLLNEAARIDGNNADVVANMTTTSLLLHRPNDLIGRLTSALFSLTPKHAFVSDWEVKSALFDQCAAKYHS